MSHIFDHCMRTWTESLQDYTLFSQVQHYSNPRQPPKKHICQGKIYLSKSKMTPQK